MLDIKNIELILKDFPDFNFRDLQYITSFDYYSNNKYGLFYDYDDTFSITIGFLLVPKQIEGEAYKVGICFNDVVDVTFKGISQLIGFNIQDISEKGLEGIRYLIEDYENDGINFYCQSIQIISLDKLL